MQKKQQKPSDKFKKVERKKIIPLGFLLKFDPPIIGITI